MPLEILAIHQNLKAVSVVMNISNFNYFLVRWLEKGDTLMTESSYSDAALVYVIQVVNS